MLLTGLLPESVKKPVALTDVSRGLGTTDRDLFVKLQLLKKRLQKRQLLILSRNSEKPVRKRTPLLRRFSFPLLHSKNDNVEEMVTAAKETESYDCVLCQVHNSSYLMKIWKSDKNYSFMAKDNVCDEDIKSVVSKVTEKLETYKATAQEISDSVQGVYNSLDMRLQNAVWKGDITEEVATERIDLFEKKLMRNLHRKLFRKVLEEEEEIDHNLNTKISQLHWITAQHLAAKINESDAQTVELLHKAMLDIASMNFKESPGEKLECIMNCSRQIFALLRRHPDSTESADDYLPVLVHIVLRVNPSWLHSNIKYILLFSNSDRVIKGEEGYYFTHLCSAVSFIETINSDSLNMSEEKFESLTSSYLNNGQQISVNRSLADGICKVYNQAAEAEAYANKQDRLMERSLAVQSQLKLLKDDISAESTRSKISKAEVSKLMASRQSRKSRTNLVFQLPNQTTATTEICKDAFINNFNAVTSEISALGSNHAANSDQKFSNQRQNLNGYSDLIIPETNSVGLKIPPTVVTNEQIHIFVPKNMLSDSVDVAFDVESYLMMNDLKER